MSLPSDNPTETRFRVVARPTPRGWTLSAGAGRGGAVRHVPDRAAIPRAARDLVAALTGYPVWQVHTDVTILDR